MNKISFSFHFFSLSQTWLEGKQDSFQLNNAPLDIKYGQRSIIFSGYREYISNEGVGIERDDLEVCVACEMLVCITTGSTLIISFQFWSIRDT